MPFLKKRPDVDVPDTYEGRGLGVESASVWARDVYVPGSAARTMARRISPNGTERKTCANAECFSKWKMPWRNNRRPIFEGQWGCSARCLEAIVRRALRRERGDSNLREDAIEPYRHRVPLGLVMLAQGWISQAQLRIALDAQRSAGQGRIGDWLMQECSVSAAQITRGLATQWGCPVLPIDGFLPEAMSLTMPRVFIEKFGLLPLRVAGSRILYVSFSDRFDASSAFALGQMSSLKVESGLLADKQFESARTRLLGSRFVEVRDESFLDDETLAARIVSLLDEDQPVASRIVRIHQHYWFRTWLEAGAYSGVGKLPSTVEDVKDTIFTLGSQV